MSVAIQTSDRFTALPDERTLAETVVALEERGLSVEVVDDLDAARERVLARIPDGSSVMTNPSVTLHKTGIAQAIDNGAPTTRRVPKRSRSTTQPRCRRSRRLGQPDFTLGSVHAITRDGTLVIASALGSPLASYAWGAANVIFVVGAQKFVADRDAAHERIFQPACRSRMPARSRPTGRTAVWARSSRSTKRIPDASTSSFIRAVIGS